MITKLTDLQQLAYDTYKGSVQKYSSEEAESALRQALVDACGGDWNFYNFQKNKWDVYQVMSEVLSIGLGELLIDKFNGFAEVKDTELGDIPEFEIEDNSLFRVATIADGNTDIRRQKLYNSKLTIATEKIAIKIYEELDRFIAGRINWQGMIDRVQLSYGHEVALRIYNAIYGSYNSLVAPYQVSGTFDETKLVDLIAHVEASTGQKAVVFGTKKALSKITITDTSDGMKDKLNLLGHYGMFRGTDLMELPQAHKPNTNDFAIDDDFLLVVPNGEKIVKVILEGDAYVYDTEAGQRNDEQIEFFFGRKVGIGVLKADRFGIYKLS